MGSHELDLPLCQGSYVAGVSVYMSCALSSLCFQELVPFVLSVHIFSYVFFTLLSLVELKSADKCMMMY